MATKNNPSLSGPEGYVRTRKEATADGNGSNASFMRTVENRPYFPLLQAVPTDEASVLEVAKIVVAANTNTNTNITSQSNNDDDQKSGDAPPAAADRIKSKRPKTERHAGRVTVITGGLTNALFKVDLPESADGVLVRLFGGDGLIDRDDEAATLARLCDADHAVHAGIDVLGRFGNGRVETWLPGMRQADPARDFEREGFALEMARQLARLHYGFELEPDSAGRRREPSLWRVAEAWIEELGHKLQEKCGEDAFLLRLFSRVTIDALARPPSRDDASTSLTSGAATSAHVTAVLSRELAWLRATVDSRFPRAPVAFCHNDANAANILLHAATVDAADADTAYDRQSVCLIDYEYGARNYVAFDVANFFCEHCGGLDDGVPDAARFPSPERRRRFVEEYVRARDGTVAGAAAGGQEIAGVDDLCAQADVFELASHLFWGIWGVLQAATEVTEGTFVREDAAERLEGKAASDTWDNLRYGKNRLERYLGRKKNMTSVEW